MNKYLLNRLYPFSIFEYVVLPKMRYKLIAVGNIMLESLTVEDIANFQESAKFNDNIRFAFVVEAVDLEAAGQLLDTMFKHIESVL